MKKVSARALSLTLVLMLLFSGCTVPGNTGNQPAQDAKTQINDLVYPRTLTRELETFNALYSQRAEDFENLTNLVDPLLEVDIYGSLVPALAESWSTEDGGLTWTFNIRKGVKWVDMKANEKADVTAQDWATGLEWVLNFHKNNSNNTSMPIEMIDGAKEYYDYTKAMEKDAALALTGGEGSAFREMVGIEIPNDHTVIYHCITNKPYFDSVATYVCLYPMAQGMVDELGGPANVAAMNNTNMWYNGAYTMTSYIQGNEKIFTANPKYWDKDCYLFDTVTIKMVESADVAFQLYEAGEVDYVTLTEANLKTISGNPDHQFHNYLVPDVPSKYSYQFHFNFNKNKEDGTPDTNWNTAIANTAFRQAWYYGLDLVEYYKRTNAIDPMLCENNFYTMRGLVYTSKGVEYTDLVRQEMNLPANNGKSMIRLDAEKTAALKAQAVEELTALGVTFPVSIDYYISASSQTALDSANVLKQIFADGLGADFVTFNIKTFVSSNRNEVIIPHLHSIALSGWGADYGDPQNYLGQECYGNDNAYYSENYSYINEITDYNSYNTDLLDAYKEFTRLADAADAITTDLDARYAAYAKAEAVMLDKALVVPLSYSVGWALSKIDNSSRTFSMFGIQDGKFKNWRTNSEGYTTEMASELSAIKDSGKK